MRDDLGKILFVSVSTMFIFGTATCAAKPPHPKKNQKNLFSLSLLHFDASRQPHGLDWYTNSPEGKQILGAIVASFGVPPSYVELATAAVPPPVTTGEQTDYRLPLTPGYAPCTARITVKSILPADTAVSTINAAINPTEIQMTTVTPYGKPGDGQRSAEGDILYYGIKPEYLKEFIRKGVCRPISKQEFLFHCRTQASCNPGATWGDPTAAAHAMESLTKDRRR